MITPICSCAVADWYGHTDTTHHPHLAQTSGLLCPDAAVIRNVCDPFGGSSRQKIVECGKIREAMRSTSVHPRTLDGAHKQRRRRMVSAAASAPLTAVGSAARAASAYLETDLPADARPLPPLNRKDQGVSSSEAPYAARLTHSLLNAGGVEFVASWRADLGLYELVGRSGTIRWQRFATADGRLLYKIHSIEGENPIRSIDGRALSTLEAEIAAAGGRMKPVDPSKTTHPDIFARLSQIWDSDRAPDLVYIPTGGGDPNHPGAGSHGVLTVSQSRAPLIISGPGIVHGRESDELVRNVDVAPTIAQFLGVKPVDGTNATGVRKQQWLKWQDGDSLAPAVADARYGASINGAARRAMMFVLDGASHTVLLDEVKKGNLPNIARLMELGVTFKNGSLSDYPTVTWANQNTLTTGAAPGHHWEINNSWYNRETGREQLVTDGSKANTLRTGRLMNPEVETLYEAVRRSFGSDGLSMAINHPSGRGATVSILDLAGFGRILSRGIGVLRRFLDGTRTVMDRSHQDEPDYHSASWQDNLGVAIGQSLIAGGSDPRLGIFEITLTDNMGHLDGPQSIRARAALREADRNIGRIMQELTRRGEFDSTMFVVTADHGMEHSYLTKDKLGGWYDAIRTSGVKAVESTRFVYIKNMQWSAHGSTPMPGQSSSIAIRVANDDTNERGVKPAIAGATVVIRDDAGHSWTACTGPDGVARVDVAPGVDATQLHISIDHPAFTREEGVLTLGGNARLRGRAAGVEHTRRHPR